MERLFQDQIERIDRLMTIIEADDPYKAMSGLSFYDVIVFACQSMWHLKDWVLNDHRFGAKDVAVLKAEIHAARCLQICSDIANGTKHLSLNRPKVGGKLSDRMGFHLDSSNGIFQEFYYIECPDLTDEYNGVEVRALLRKCRDTWDGIICKHHLSIVGDWLSPQQTI